MQKSLKDSGGMGGWLVTNLGRILISLIVPVITFVVLWQGFIFLRDSQAPKLVIVLVAIIWGVGGVALLYTVSNWLVEQLPAEWTQRLQPFVFVGPGVAILFWFLALPVVRTLILSFNGPTGKGFVGFDNYKFAFTDRIMLETFRNNLLWMVFGTFFCVSLGLLIAVLADRSRYEAIYKAIIFMPMAISFVGAGVIWKFIYTYKGDRFSHGRHIPAVAVTTPVEQFPADRYHGLVADRVRHGDHLFGHQGHSIRVIGSGSHRWRH
jgi:alpha-glucoside transport system permease protein